MPREECQKWLLSGNLGMARPIVIKFGVFRDRVAMHITQVMDGVHLHVRTCATAGADVPPFPHLGNGWMDCAEI